MTPVGIAKVAAAVVSVVVKVGDSKTGPGTRVSLLGIPVYDSNWEGVKRRKARREARRAERK